MCQRLVVYLDGLCAVKKSLVIYLMRNMDCVVLCARLCARKKWGLVVYLEETWAMCLAVCRNFDDLFYYFP